MKTLSNIVECIKKIETPGGEVLYSLWELENQLSKMGDDTDIIVTDCIITPNYVCEGGRYELYEYELNIRIKDNPDFEQYLLGKTGKSDLSDIPSEVVTLNQECYIEVQKQSGTLSVMRIKRYIAYLHNTKECISQIQDIFNEFNIQNLWFTFY